MKTKLIYKNKPVVIVNIDDVNQTYFIANKHGIIKEIPQIEIDYLDVAVTI
jgi:hypothetical protein